MNEQAARLTDYLTALSVTYGMNVLGAILILIAGYLISGWAAKVITRGMRKSTHIDKVFHTLPGRIARVGILIITLIAVLNRFGVETTSLIAVMGAAGLAIGLALQGTLSNVAAGVMLLVFRPFHIGDAVKIDGDVYVIDSVGFFICKAHLPDGPMAYVPNSKIWGQTIVNLSVTDQDRRRIDEVYGIGYGDDIGTALEVLKGIAAADSRVLTDPAPLIKVESLGESSVNVLFRVWTARTDWWDAKLDLLRASKEALDGAGISIPFPQRDLHIIREPQEAQPAPAPAVLAHSSLSESR